MLYSHTIKLVRFFEGVDGLKTGYTKNAMYCLTATGMRNNVRLVSVVMGSSTSELRSEDTINMLSYGFNGFKIINILKSSDVLGKGMVNKGKKEMIDIVLLEDLNEVVKNTSENNDYTYEIELDNIEAPVKHGEVVGKLYLLDKNNKKIKEVDVTVKEDVLKANYFDMIIKNIKCLLKGKNIFN